VHEIGVDGTQVIADSDGLPADIDAAWRAKGGALWVGLEGSLDREASIGRLDSGALDTLLDRFDLRVPVHMPGVDALVAGDRGEPSADRTPRSEELSNPLLEWAA
jgi:hypothetical protein